MKLKGIWVVLLIILIIKAQFNIIEDCYKKTKNKCLDLKSECVINEDLCIYKINISDELKNKKECKNSISYCYYCCIDGQCKNKTDCLNNFDSITKYILGIFFILISPIIIFLIILVILKNKNKKKLNELKLLN